MIFNYPGDDLVKVATISLVTGTAVAGYPVANVQNDNLAQTFQCTGTSALIGIDLGSSIAPRFAAVCHTNIASSVANFRLIGYSDAFITATETYDFARLGMLSDGFSEDSYLSSVLATATARRYFGLYVQTNAVNVQIGRVWLSGASRTMDQPVSRGYLRTEAHPAIVHPTNLGVRLVYQQGQKVERVSGTLRTSAANLATLQALERDAFSTGRAFPLVLDSTQNEVLFVRWDDAFVMQPTVLGPALYDVPVNFVAVSRGLRL